MGLYESVTNPFFSFTCVETNMDLYFAGRLCCYDLWREIEIIIKISDLLGLTIDELLRSDEELTKQVIKESKQLAYPRLKFMFDVLFLVGFVLLVTKIGLLVWNKFTQLDVTLPGGIFLWNAGPLILMVVAGIGSGMLKEKYKQD